MKKIVFKLKLAKPIIHFFVEICLALFNVFT